MDAKKSLEYALNIFIDERRYFMTKHQRRWIELDGTRNCRDLGGIPVDNGATKYNTLFRSDALHLLSESDQLTLADLSLESIIDMRVGFEKKKAPNRLSSELAARQLDRSFLPNRTNELFEKVNNGELDGPSARRFMLQQYRVLTLEHTENYRAIFKDILSASGHAVLFHCTSGKDRTGMMSALVLAALGASNDDIIDDYILTNGRIAPISFFDDGVDPQVIRYIMAAEADYMATALATMQDEFGSINNYLREALEIGELDRLKLRESLVA